MPNRIIKETLRTSRKVNNLTDFQFRLWVYLITYVDDYGRGSADPELLKGMVFPRRKGITETQIKNGLTDLASAGMIDLYENDGELYFYFPNWKNHQRIQTKKAKFPEPPSADDADTDSRRVTVGHGDSRWTTVNHGELPCNTVTHGDSPPESNPIQYKKNPNICASEKADSVFSRLWDAYPKKKGRSAVTKKAKQEIFKAGEDVVMGAIHKYQQEIAEKGTEEQYVLYGSTFFNGRWKDYMSTETPKAAPQASTERPGGPITLKAEDVTAENMPYPGDIVTRVNNVGATLSYKWKKRDTPLFTGDDRFKTVKEYLDWIDQ